MQCGTDQQNGHAQRNPPAASTKSGSYGDYHAAIQIRPVQLMFCSHQFSCQWNPSLAAAHCDDHARWDVRTTQFAGSSVHRAPSDWVYNFRRLSHPEIMDLHHSAPAIRWRQLRAPERPNDDTDPVGAALTAVLSKGRPQHRQ